MTPSASHDIYKPSFVPVLRLYLEQCLLMDLVVWQGMQKVSHTRRCGAVQDRIGLAELMVQQIPPHNRRAE